MFTEDLLPKFSRASAVRLVDQQGKVWPGTGGYFFENQRNYPALVFRPPFPLDAALKLEIPPDLQDQTKRRLVNAAQFPLKVQTGGIPPLVKFASSFGIAEFQNGQECSR